MRWPFGKREKKAPLASWPVTIKARFDSAQTTADNRRHWANADALAADAAASPGIRQTLRNRSRYEVANNCYARRIVLAMANYVIGTGPRLQMLLEDEQDTDINGRIEREFAAWAKAIGLAGKLRTMRMAKAQDGETFGMLMTNSNLPASVKLDMRLLEADQVATPGFSATGPNAADGIVFDKFGNPQTYHVLKSHPGSSLGTGLNKDDVPAASMVHWFRADRPGQSRGLTELLPALPLFAYLRRWTLATVAAAETAANISAVMGTNAPAGGEAAAVEPMAEMELANNTAIFAPQGWTATQMKPEQPGTTYPAGKREVISEIASCLLIPYSIAAGDSSNLNYASGRLDHQAYMKSIGIEQAEVESVILDRLLEEWLREAVPVLGLGAIGNLTIAPHQWFWDGQEHVDPTKEAQADDTRLRNGTLGFPAYFAGQGQDWEVEQDSAARSLGMTIEEYRKRLVDSLFRVGGAPASAKQPQSDEEPVPQEQDQ
ncbi:MAG: phage portal protein [Acidobacteria bacterium]|nr:phage portal protein [Acidobacteriota bacterium]